MCRCPVRRWVICLWKESVNKSWTGDRENRCFLAWFLWMAVYYGFRLFHLTPWYDELYTYYYFISRGPVYAAVHWPLPNNHVGYSVLSGFLDLLGSPMVGLRGMSYIAALANLALLYRIGRKCFSSGWAFCCVVLYSCMNLINQLAVQGRGYTLAVTCFLAAVSMIQEIGWKEGEGTKKDIKYYVIFALSLTLGLYILPSSVYWVIPVCVTGGLFLLFYKKIRPLLYLIASGAAAAVSTVFLYAVIWLAIGSNLLSKAEGGSFYGQGHISIIRSAPVLAARTGMNYMLETPYIQSVGRDGYFTRMAGWLRSLFNLYYPNGKIFLLASAAIGIVFAAWRARKEYKEGRKERFFLLLFVEVMLVMTPVFLIVQNALPYFRVFSYMGIPLAVLLCILLRSVGESGYWQRLMEWCGRKGAMISKNGSLGPYITKIPVAFIVLSAVRLLLSKGYNGEYGMTEYYARDALEQADIGGDERLCVTDCYQQYLLKFYYGIECGNTAMEEADMALLHKEMAVKEDAGFRWEFYHNYETIPWEEINDGMEPVYENEEYIVYKRKQER